MKTRDAVLMAMVTIVTAACAHYDYKNVRYSSREEATAAARADISTTESGVKPSSSRLGGVVVIVIPTRDSIEQFGVRHGSAATSDVVGYVADVVEMGLLARADTVAKSQIFDKTAVVRSSDTEHYPSDGYDYKLWLLGVELGRWQWYLSKSGSGERQPVSQDSALSSSQREDSFNASILRAASALGVTVSNAAAGKASEREAKTVAAKGSGTGFFINDGGMAMTNAHVIVGCTSLQVFTRDGGGAPATIVAMDTENDLALVHTPNHGSGHAEIRVRPPVRQGEKVVVYGFPLVGALSSTGNLAIGNVSALAGLGDDTSKFQISAPVQPGNSGGPLLDAGGSVIGVVAGKLNAIKAASITGDIPQNVNFAIKAAVVTSFLEANGVSFSSTQLRKPQEPEDIADAAKRFTFMLECH